MATEPHHLSVRSLQVVVPLLIFSSHLIWTFSAVIQACYFLPCCRKEQINCFLSLITLHSFEAYHIFLFLSPVFPEVNISISFDSWSSLLTNFPALWIFSLVYNSPASGFLKLDRVNLHKFSSAGWWRTILCITLVLARMELAFFIATSIALSFRFVVKMAIVQTFSVLQSGAYIAPRSPVSCAALSVRRGCSQVNCFPRNDRTSACPWEIVN